MKIKKDCLIINETKSTVLNSKYECFLFLPTETIQNVTFSAGEYLIELWGASGAGASEEGGKGGYTNGIINFPKTTTAYFGIGTQGQKPRGYHAPGKGGFNGGSDGGYSHHLSAFGSGGSGGGTDLRLISFKYESRILVAGGGGSSSSFVSCMGGNAGGLEGQLGLPYDLGGKGGTQTTGYRIGIGEKGKDSYYASGAGGGGYFGGESGLIIGFSAGGGGGGSSYASQKRFNNIVLLSGNETIPIISATIKDMGKFMTGNIGDGAARVTILKLRTVQPKFNYRKSYKLFVLFGYQ